MRGREQSSSSATQHRAGPGGRPALLTSCSVMLIRSSCCRNCSRMYLGAISTRDCRGGGMKDIRPQHRSGTASVCRPSTAPPQTAAPGGQCGVCAHTDSHANRSLCPMTAQPTRYRRGPPHLSALNAAQGRRWGTEPSGRGFSLPTKLPALRTQSSPRGSNSPGAALHCTALHCTAPVWPRGSFPAAPQSAHA